MNQTGMIRALVLPLLLASCGATKPAQEPNTVTSEEVRLADLGQNRQKLELGTVYRVVGRIRNIAAAADGNPAITFTGLVLNVAKGSDLAIVKRMKPGDYISADCKLVGVQSGIFPEMTDCRNLTFPTVMSAEEYESAYSVNVFSADDVLNGRPLVIFGKVRLLGKLNGGEDYVALEAQEGFSDVTAIVAPDSRPMIRSFAKVGELAVLFCQGGHRYNQVGSIGVTNCRFLQNY